MAPSPPPLPTCPPAFSQRRAWPWRAAGKAYLLLAGWRIEGTFPDRPKVVAIVAPHTSNWDFLLGVAILFALDLKVSWLGKHALFRPPFRALLRWMGGIPVDRRASHGVVGACARAFEAAPSLLLALAPEGTRKGVSQWRTGFYHIALAADVPIFPVGFDYRDHAVRLMDLFFPTGDLEGDLAELQARFHSVHGLRGRPEA